MAYLNFPDMKSNTIFPNLSECTIDHAITDAFKSILN